MRTALLSISILALGATMGCGDVVGRTYASEAELVAALPDFRPIGRFATRWPARVARVADAEDRIDFRLRGLAPQSYTGYAGYRLRVVFLTPVSGGEAAVVFRSVGKATPSAAPLR